MSLRIAMWSGPRNISTAMMRAFENRGDCAVIDEPFYAAYLAATGLDHPMRAEILQAQSQNWQQVASHLTGPIPNNQPIFYQKHMTHHMLPQFGRAWMASCVNIFLIRTPAQVLASYAQRRADITLDDIGFRQQAELYDAESQRLGHPPIVIDATDILSDPPTKLSALCTALGINFSEKMLHWPAGPRPTDGIWAPAWYKAVENSTSFAPQPANPAIPEHLQKIADQADVFYNNLAKFKL